MNDRFIGYADFPAKTRPGVSDAPTPGARFLLFAYLVRSAEQRTGICGQDVGKGRAGASPRPTLPQNRHFQ